MYKSTLRTFCTLRISKTASRRSEWRSPRLRYAARVSCPCTTAPFFMRLCRLDMQGLFLFTPRILWPCSFHSSHSLLSLLSHYSLFSHHTSLARIRSVRYNEHARLGLPLAVAVCAASWPRRDTGLPDSGGPLSAQGSDVGCFVALYRSCGVGW
jgi:hypothetical protein